MILETVEIKVFSTFFGLLMGGSWSVQIITDPDPEGAKKLPDPEH
jgi:hypothetical protein